MSVVQTKVFQNWTGITTAPLNFSDVKFGSSDEVAVYYVDAAGLTVKAVNPTHYSAAVASNNIGATVTPTALLVTLAGGRRVTAVRETALTQPTNLAADDSNRMVNVERTLDRLMRQVQEIAENAGRAVRISKGEGGISTLPGDRSGKILAFDENGPVLRLPIEVSDSALTGKANINFSNVSDKATARANIEALGATSDADQVKITAVSAPAVKRSLTEWLNPAGEFDFNKRYVGPLLVAGADATTAFQVAMMEIVLLPAQNRTIRLAADTYLITAPVVAPGTGGAISFVGQRRGSGGSYIICAPATPSGETRMAFDMRNSAARFLNLSFLASTAPVAIRSKKTSNVDDSDLVVEGCEFLSFSEAAIDHYGRGLLCQNNVFAAGNFAVQMQWPTMAEDATWAAGVSGSGDQALPTGYRAMILRNNRGHSMSRMFRTIGENSQYWSGLVLGNYMDIGRSFWSGGCSKTDFIGNKIETCTTNIIAIDKGGKKNRFRANTFGGDTLSDPSLQAINYSGAAVFEDVDVVGNTFDRFRSAPIVTAGDVVNSVIRNNSFRDWGRLIADVSAISIGGALTNSTLDNDYGPAMQSGATAKSGAYCVSVAGAIDGNSRVLGIVAAGAGASLLSAGSIDAKALIQWDEPGLWRGRRGPISQVDAFLYSVSTRNGTWVVGDNFGGYIVETADTNGGGAGVAGAMRLKSGTTTGSSAYWEWSISTSSIRDAARMRLDAAALSPVVDITCSLGTAALRWNGIWSNTITLSPGIGTILNPVNNGEIVVQTSSNTALSFKVKGSDGTIRSATLTLA